MNLRRVGRARGFIAAVVIAFAFLGPSPAHANGSLRGAWHGPAGLTRITVHGTHVVGVLVSKSAACGLAAGARVLDGNLLLGNLTGKLRLCTPGCKKGASRWGFAMLVGRRDRLAGAVHVDAGPCKVVGRSAKGGVVLDRVHRARRRRHPTRTPHRATARGDEGGAGSSPGGETYDPRHAGEARSQAMDIARAGLDLLDHGRFEEARARFKAAVAADPGYAEGYNGIGVTYAMRRDWKTAVKWYQRSIAANPDIGDAYYNLACAYAQIHEPVLAVRYLRLAVLNGYSQIPEITRDPDLAPLRGRADYRAVLALGATAGH